MGKLKKAAVASVGVATAAIIAVGISSGDLGTHSAPPTPAEISGAPVMTTTFVQPSINSTYPTIDWTRAQWDHEFSLMKQVGIRQVIVQWTVDQDAGQSYFPTTNSTYPEATDMVGNIMLAAQDEGMEKVWLGLDNTYSWQTFAGNTTWLQAQAVADEDTADRLYKLYENDIAGWYISNEVNDNLLNTPADIPPMTTFFNTLTDYLHANDGEHQVMESPTYENLVLTSTSFASGLRTIMPGMDIINLQDSGGSGYVSPSSIAYWFTGMKVEFAGTNTQVWDDPDMFASGGAMPTSQLEQDMQAAYGDVSRYAGFSFTTELDPAVVGTGPYTAYQAYANNYINGEVQ